LTASKWVSGTVDGNKTRSPPPFHVNFPHSF
jgi:hypothetical protein